VPLVASVDTGAGTFAISGGTIISSGTVLAFAGYSSGTFTFTGGTCTASGTVSFGTLQQMYLGSASNEVSVIGGNIVGGKASIQGNAPALYSVWDTPGGSTLSGDVTGSTSANTVVKVQGVAQTSTSATIMAQQGNVQTRTVNATVAAGETTYCNTSGLTFTLPASPQAGTINRFLLGANGATISGNGANIFTAAGTSTTYALHGSGIIEFIWTGSLWYVLADNVAKDLIAPGSNGAIPYNNGTFASLSGNTTTTPQFVTSTGTGSAAQAPTLTSSTGTGNVVLSTSPTLVTPALGAATATSITSSGEVSATDLKATGLTGATAGARFVGGTVNGAPTSGTWTVGDFVIDQTATVWVYTGSTAGWSTTISNHLVLRSATATVGRNEITVFTGAAGQTLSTPSNPIDGSSWTIINNSANSVTLSFANSMYPLGSGSSVTTYTLSAYGTLSFVNYSGGNWYMTNSNNLSNLIGTLSLTSNVTGTLPVANGGTGVTTSTGSGNVVLSTSPTLVTPALGTPASGVMTNVTGLPLTTGVTGTLPVANGGTGVTTSTGSGNNVLSTNPVITGPYEPVGISATALSGSVAASVAIATDAVYYYTANPTAAWALNITNAPTTTGQSATVAILVNNGATAYLPSNITINTVQAGASSSALPLQGATNNSITSYYQGATAWASADASTLDVYTITVICTGSSAWTLLLGLTKF
jgi:hypothetical protein